MDIQADGQTNSMKDKQMIDRLTEGQMDRGTELIF